MLRQRGQVNFQTLLQVLEVSRATIKRDLAFLRDQLGYAIKYDRAEDAYRIDDSNKVGDRLEIPGLVLTQKELLAVLICSQLLSELDPHGALARNVEPLLDRIKELLGEPDGSDSEVSQRLHVMPTAGRLADAECFEAVCLALLKRRRLTLSYITRSREEATSRVVSPQRMVHHRNTWYLDAWCHERQALRRFSLDSITGATARAEDAQECSMDSVRSFFDEGYGVYAGPELRHAHLIFSPWAARWVTKEKWHKNQTQRVLEDQRLELVVPYTNATELRMDIMRYGAEVEVVGPPDLRREVATSLRHAASLYGDFMSVIPA